MRPARAGQILPDAIALNRRLDRSFGFQYPSLWDSITETQRRILIIIATDLSGIEMIDGGSAWYDARRWDDIARSIISMGGRIQVLAQLRGCEEDDVLKGRFQLLQHFLIVGRKHHAQM